MNILNIPNILTISRIFLTPLISHYIYINNIKIASLIFIIASLTDFLDGFIARLLKQETNIGLYLDPLADKFFVIYTYYSIIQFYNINNILLINLFNFILLKDIILFLGSIFFGIYKKSISIKPNIIGKINTFIQIIFIIYIFLCYKNSINFFIFNLFVYLIFLLSFFVLLSYSSRLIESI